MTTEIASRFKMMSETQPEFKTSYVPVSDMQSFFNTTLRLVEQHPRVKDGIGILLLGQSGAGKSAVLRALQRRAIKEFQSDKVQLPAILAPMPSPCTNKAISLALRRAAGDMAEANSATMNLDMIERLYPNLGVRLIAIDEVHNIGIDRGDLASSKRFFVKRLINNLKGVWVFCGLPQVEHIFRQDPELDRRIRYRFNVPAFDWSVSHDRQAFTRYLYKLDKGTGLEESGLSTPDIVGRIWEASRGLRGIAFDLVDQCRSLALRRGAAQSATDG